MQSLASGTPRDRTQLRRVCRHLCRVDLYFLLRYAFQREDAEHPWLLDRCREIEANPNGRLDLWAREHYKAVDLHEPVPTPNGWRPHGELEAGDYVYGSDGQPCKVVATSKVFVDADCYAVEFDDGYEVVVSGDHLWSVEIRTRKRDGKGGRLYREKSVVKTRDLAKMEHLPDRRAAVPVAGPVDHNRPTCLPLDPYVLGAWLGDGTASVGSITCGDPEVFQEIERRGYQTSAGRGSKRLCRTVYGIQGILRSLGLLKKKHIPKEYLRAPAEQRWALLRGLMDTDGCINPRGTATFTNKSARLTHNVFELAASLGLKPRRTEYIYPHGTVYYISFQAYRTAPVFQIERKRQRQKAGVRTPRRFIRAVVPVPTRLVSCIQVDRPDGEYLIGRHFVTTHNSTLITYGKTIQDILASHGVDPLPEWEGREVTIGIFSHTRPIAKKFLRQIKLELQENKLLKEWFPDILWGNPKAEAPKWSEDDGLVVRRKSNPKESTVEAWGLVDGQPTGAHFVIRLYDDVVTNESVNTSDMILKTTERWEMSLNLGVDGGYERYVGTRYDDADTYGTMLERGVAVPRIYPATDNGQPDGNPVFMSPGYLAFKRRGMGPHVFSCQMLLDPVSADDAFFQLEWLNYYRVLPAHLRIYMASDYAVGEDEGCYTVHLVFGIDPAGRFYVVDLWREQTLSNTWAQEGADLVVQHRPLLWGEEKGQIEKSVGPYLNELLRRRRIHVTRKAYTSDVNKVKRAVPVQARMADGGIYLPAEAPWLEDLKYEIKRFPKGKFKDQVDCFSLAEKMLDEDDRVHYDRRKHVQ